MRILWLCNIMLPMIAEQLNMESSNKEGWLTGLAQTLLEKRAENDIQLAVAFPMSEDLFYRLGTDPGSLRGVKKHIYDGNVIFSHRGELSWYAFEEDVKNPHCYQEELETSMHLILRDFEPDAVHCFGTEYPHTLALCRAFPDKQRILVGIQGLCKVYANTYFADLPDRVIRQATVRDVLKRDTLIRQKEKFELRGKMEEEAIRLAGNVTGRTAWDLHYTGEWHPGVRYFAMNETLRRNFYTGQWDEGSCEQHSIFLSQGDYPVKGFHYMLPALAKIRKVYPDAKVYVAGNSITGGESLYTRLKISAYGKYLRSLLEKYNLWDSVVFLGRLDAEQMKERYLKSHLFVCCSTIENSPNSLGEAMLLGVPCVSADVGGIDSIFEDGRDGILYRGFLTEANSYDRSKMSRSRSGKEKKKKRLAENASHLAKAVIDMWSDPARMKEYSAHAREHARRTHDAETNFLRLMEIYREICLAPAAGTTEATETFTFVSNYINHHQIPFCDAMRKRLGDGFTFIQTEPMEEERVRMGWSGEIPPYVRFYYENEAECQALIDRSDYVLFGGSDEERYIRERLDAKKPTVRYSERIYKGGQWKAISPRGLVRKYQDHTRYRSGPVWMLCAGAYVSSDFRIVRAYPGKMFKWGYFPAFKEADEQRLAQEKTPGSILWAARFLDWKHPERALQCAKYLKDKKIPFHLNIIGGGDMQQTVEDLIRKYDLKDEVTLLGYKTPAEVRRQMETAQIYLATSDRKEGWGAVINEAMNSGCAVIADHLMGAAPYLIRHGENGMLYNDQKPEELFACAERLLADPEECRRLGAAAYATIRDEWNAEIAADRLLAFIKTGKVCESGPLSVAEIMSERRRP